MSIIVDSGDETHFVKISGELDAASCGSVTRACTAGRAATVIVDLSAVTFLDTGGHSGFAAARTILAEHGRTLELVGAVGGPRRLLDLIDVIDQPAPA